LGLHGFFFNRFRVFGPRSFIAELRGFKIRLSQNRLLTTECNSKTEKMIIFFTPGRDIINGGILSISSIFENTKKLKHIHNAEVLMCTIPGDPMLLRYTKFKNQNFVYRFSQILAYYKDLRSLMVHIPEYAVFNFLRNISYKDISRLNDIENIHINVMLQNIEALPPLKYIKELKNFGKLTVTTAHERYSTIELRRELGISLHMLSVFVSPEQYDRRDYGEKQNLLIVSPDKHPKKAEILEKIANSFPYLKIQEISNLTYEEYKEVISRAKWALTFGEGLDGYFVETVFSGGISFSVYNSKFFTEDFKSLRTVYDTYDSLVEKICSDIKNLDNRISYTEYCNRQFKLCSKYYNYRNYIHNLELFYKEEYTYE
jgi:hypothetical protein